MRIAKGAFNNHVDRIMPLFDPLPQWDIYDHGYCVSLQKYCRSKSNFFILCPSVISHCAPPTQPRPWYCQHCYWMAPKLKWCCDSSIQDVVHLTKGHSGKMCVNYLAKNQKMGVNNLAKNLATIIWNIRKYENGKVELLLWQFNSRCNAI